MVAREARLNCAVVCELEREEVTFGACVFRGKPRSQAEACGRTEAPAAGGQARKSGQLLWIVWRNRGISHVLCCGDLQPTRDCVGQFAAFDHETLSYATHSLYCSFTYKCYLAV